jgi:hypothetical protein
VVAVVVLMVGTFPMVIGVVYRTENGRRRRRRTVVVMVSMRIPPWTKMMMILLDPIIENIQISLWMSFFSGGFFLLDQWNFILKKPKNEDVKCL